MAYGGGYYFQKPELTDVPDNARVLVYDASSNTDKNFTGAFLKGYFARSGHNHVFSNISGLQSALDSKSEVGHGHTIPYITGLQAILDGKVDLTDPRLTDAREPLPHTQAASTITGLAPVATFGNYSSLTGKPTIPAPQVNSDWLATGGAAQILNRPAETCAGRFTYDGNTIVCTVTGGIRSLLYDANGANPSSAMVSFGAEMRMNGTVVPPDTYAWSVPATGTLLSGASSTATFTPVVAPTFSAGAADNRVDVDLTYAGYTCRATAPVPATKIGATGSQGSPDTKTDIYNKIKVGVTGDVLLTQCGPGDTAGFAAREVRDVAGNIMLTYTCGGMVTVYQLPGDTSSTVKLAVRGTDGINRFEVTAGGTVTIR